MKKLLVMLTALLMLALLPMTASGETIHIVIPKNKTSWAVILQMGNTYVLEFVSDLNNFNNAPGITSCTT